MLTKRLLLVACLLALAFPAQAEECPKAPVGTAPATQADAQTPCTIDTLASRRDLRWLRRSAEYAVIAQQTYFLAEQSLRSLLATHPHGVPWVVAIDADETIFDNTDGEVRLLPKPSDAPFDVAQWEKWVSEESAGAIPGARRFLDQVVALGGQIAVITNRSAAQDEHTRANLKRIGIDYGPDRLCILGRSDPDRKKNNEEEWQRFGFRNDKDRRRRLVTLGLAESCWAGLAPSEQEAARAAWAHPHDILMYIGDNIQDLPGMTPEAADSPALMREIAANPRYILLPNPTYGGSWERRDKRAVWE